MFDVKELQRSPGSMRTIQEQVAAPEALGTAVIGVPAGSDLDLDLRLEAVHEGVLVSGAVAAHAVGECIRCLDPVAYDLHVDIQELYVSPETDGTPQEADEEDVAFIENDDVDLEPLLRDSLVTALPFQPLCRDDCAGLCAQCGARLEDNPGHAHEERDPRWDALRALTDPEVTNDKSSSN